MRLVAGREWRERSRLRSFRLVTLLLVVAGLAVVIVPPLIAGSDEPTALGIVAPAVAGLEAALTGAAEARGVALRPRAQPDGARAEAAVEAGDLDAAIVEALTLTRAQAGLSFPARIWLAASWPGAPR